MAAKLILVGLFLFVLASAQDEQTGSRRGFVPRRLPSRPREQSTQPPTQQNSQDDEALLERRRLFLKSALRRRLPNRNPVAAVEDEEKEDVNIPVKEEVSGKIVNDLPNLDSPVEKLFNNEIREAILGEKEESSPFQGISVVKTVSEPSGLRNLNEQIVRINFKSRPTTSPLTTTTTETTTKFTGPNRKFLRKFRPTARPRDDKPETEEPTERPVRGQLPIRRRLKLKNGEENQEDRPRNFPRKFETKVRRPAFRPRTTSAPEIAREVTEVTEVPEVAEVTTTETRVAQLPLTGNGRFESAEADAALEALLKTASQPDTTAKPVETIPPVTQALEDVTEAANEEEAAILEMKEDIRNIIPRKQTVTNTRLRSRARGGIRTRPNSVESTERSTENRFKSFPAHNKRFQAQARASFLNRPQNQRRRPEEPRSLDAAQEKIPETDKIEEIEEEESIAETTTTTAAPTVSFHSFTPTAAPQFPTNVPAVFKDLNLPTPTSSIGFTTVGDGSVRETVFQRTFPRPTPPSQEPSTAREQFVFRTQPTQQPLAVRPVEVPTSLPEVVLPADNRNAILLLQNNRFDTFDAQFGGAVPFNSNSQTETRFPGRRPLPQVQPLATFDRPAAAPAFRAQTFASQPITAQQTFSQPIRTQQTFSQPLAAQQSFQSQPISAQQTFFQPTTAQQTFSQPIRSEQTVPQSSTSFISLPAGTFTGHPAQNININTGTFSLSTGL